MIREYTIEELLPALNRTATATGTGVDLQGKINPGGREMKAYLNVGLGVSSASPVDNTLDVKIQESDALGSGYTDISGATFTQVAGVSPTSETIHFQTNKRYVRAIGTQAGTGDEFDYGVFLVARERMTIA
jgi:hypothetical protein